MQVELHATDVIDIRTEETKLKFLELFATGVSASTAYHTHRANLREQNPDNFARVLCDRSVSPDFPWVCNFHQKYTLEKFGSIDGPDAMLRAIQHAEKLCCIRLPLCDLALSRGIMR